MIHGFLPIRVPERPVIGRPVAPREDVFPNALAVADQLTPSRPRFADAAVIGACGAAITGGPALVASLAGVPFGVAGRVVGGIAGAVAEYAIIHNTVNGMDAEARTAVRMWGGITAGVSGAAGALFGWPAAGILAAAGGAIGAWSALKH